MRISHWERLAPVCPRCKSLSQTDVSLQLALIERESGDSIDEGVIHCPADGCRQEYPIIDGVPIIVPNVRDYVVAYSSQLLKRRDLSVTIESLLGDCLGAEDPFNMNRYYLSGYSHDAYSDQTDGDPARAHVSHELLSSCVTQMDSLAPGITLDVGCGVGRSALELAAMSDDLVLGVDMSFAFAQFSTGVVTGAQRFYDRRLYGLVYERVALNVLSAASKRCDFWVCDGQHLPFSDAVFGNVLGLNVLDSVHSPIGLIEEVGRVLQQGHKVTLATPFDWTASVTPIESWIGGHSQRSLHAGDPVKVINDMFPMRIPGGGQLEIYKQSDGVEWINSRYVRSESRYQEYLLTLIKKLV